MKYNIAVLLWIFSTGALIGSGGMLEAIGWCSVSLLALAAWVAFVDWWAGV